MFENIIGISLITLMVFVIFSIIDKKSNMEYEFDLNNEKETALFFINRELDLVQKEIEHHNDIIKAMQDIIKYESEKLKYSEVQNYSIAIEIRQKKIAVLIEERDFLEKKKIFILKHK